MEQKDALEYLVKLGNPTLVDVDDRSYSTLKLEPILDPQILPLTIHTLTGIVDYINNCVDIDQVINNTFIHILSPSQLDLYGFASDTWRQRENFLHVELFTPPPTEAGTWQNHEDFIIQIQSQFVQDEITAQILKIVGNLADETVKNFSDNGITQEVHVKTGLRAIEEKIPNPVALRPYRTFPEIEQPQSKFVLRMRTQKEKLPQAALFDADGDQWQLVAIQSIKIWLTGKLPEMVIVA